MNDLQALQAELERERKEKDALKREVEELRAQLARPHGRSPNIARAFRNRRGSGEFFAIKQIAKQHLPQERKHTKKTISKKEQRKKNNWILRRKDSLHISNARGWVCGF